MDPGQPRSLSSVAVAACGIAGAIAARFGPSSGDPYTVNSTFVAVNCGSGSSRGWD